MIGMICLVWRDDTAYRGWSRWTVSPGTHDTIRMIARIYFAPIEDSL